MACVGPPYCFRCSSVTLRKRKCVRPVTPSASFNGRYCPERPATTFSRALYGSTQHRRLLERYNDVSCVGNDRLPEGRTLTVPAEVTEVAPALLESLAPSVRQKPPGGGWEPASPGAKLYRNHSVNTLERARADILFVDRSRIVMSAHTLVVIYGTAERSTTVSSVPSIELESGELQAGLLALGSKAPIVAVKSGGDVQANSRDTVVRHRNERSTVSVFDGSAKVRSAGSTVTVPQNFGSSFRPKQKPTPPRPLPPAPTWEVESDEGILLTAEPTAVIRAAWTPVAKAATYRLEFARDAAFRDLVNREEVGPDVTAFRAERIPEGDYYLRVRVVDDEDFLGLASLTRHVTIVRITIGGGLGVIDEASIHVSPDTVLEFAPRPDLELALDDAPFGPVPPRLDLETRPVKRLRFRRPGAERESRYEILYESAPVEPPARELDVKRAPTPTPLTEPKFATAPCGSYFGSRGRSPSALFAPTACDALSVGLGSQFAHDDAEWAWVKATAQYGRLGMEAVLRTDVSTSAIHGDDAFWLGMTHRSFGRLPWSTGPALRFGIPVGARSPSTRGEVGWALAWQSPRWAVIGDLGVRSSMHDDESTRGAPTRQAFLIGGARLELDPMFTGFAQLDATLLRTTTDATIGRGGISFGLETKTPVFTAASIHLSPWQDNDGWVSTQVSLGMRR
ncbi:MAG: FecR domain-containing protein [Polyangiaceae bacterium]